MQLARTYIFQAKVWSKFPVVTNTYIYLPDTGSGFILKHSYSVANKIKQPPTSNEPVLMPITRCLIWILFRPGLTYFRH